MKKVFVIALGCGTNQADASFHASSMVDTVRVEKLEEADEVIIQTCGLSPEREAAYHEAVERCGRLAPKAKITLGGCLPFTSPKAVRAEVGQARIVKPAGLLEHLRESPGTRPEGVPWMSEENGVGFLRISTGCLDSCSYCSIWRATGKTKSRPPQLVVRDLRAARDKGLTRVRLVSEDCGAWGQEQGQDLGQLLSEIHNARLGLKISLGTFHPRWLPSLTPCLLEAMQDGTIESMLQVPIQSGSDRILKKMRRNYQARDAFENLRRLRASIPNLELYTDVVAGFSGETDADLCATLAFLLTVGFTEVSVFGFYPQGNSAATHFTDQLGERQVTSNVRFLVRELLVHDFIRSQKWSWPEYVDSLKAGTRPHPVVFQGNWLERIFSCQKEESMKHQELHEMAGQMMSIMCGSWTPRAPRNQLNEIILRFEDDWLRTDTPTLAHTLTINHVQDPTK